MNTQLSETQQSILIAAAQHPEHRLEGFPEGVKGGARAKVLGSLQNKGLIEIRQDHWVISTAGLAALGMPAPPATPPQATTPEPGENLAPEAPKARRTRENTKRARVIAMLQRPEGATLAQLVEATGWKRHTARAALSILGKKPGIRIESSQTDAGRIYRVAANLA